MEDQEKKHIVRNLDKLVNNTRWNTSCLSVPIEAGLFSDDDSSVLESIPDRRMRVLEFYRIFMTKKNSYQHLIATLAAGCQSEAINLLCELNPTEYFSQLEQQTSSCLSSRTDKNSQTIVQHSRSNGSHNSLSSIQFDVQNPVRLFTGRMRDLANLHEKLHQSRTTPTVISKMASIVGLGGIGKTELARMYIQKYAKVYDNNVIWISAETQQTMTESFRRLATDYLKISLLNVDGKEKHMKSVIEEVYNYFKGKRSLFVFDNAENTEITQKFMPLQISLSPYVLITSRDKEWSFEAEMLELQQLEEIEAVSLVTNGIQIQDQGQKDAVIELVKTLQCFPLALSQAISYIKQQQMLHNYRIEKYLDEYKSHSEKLLSCDARPAALNTYTKTTFTTWKLTTELIFADEDCGKEAMRMLNMISYFQPEKIPINLLLICDGDKQIFETSSEPGILSRIKKFFMRSQIVESFMKASDISSSPEKNEKALQLLVKYSMINIQPTDQTISIHRLVQEVIRIELREKKLEEITLENILRLLSENLDLKTITHFCSTFKYCGAYKKLVVNFKHVPWAVLKKLDSDEKFGRYSSVSIGHELNETLQNHVSSDDYAAVRLKHRIAVANLRVGNYEIAAKAFEQILPVKFENKDNMFTQTDILNVQYRLAVCLKKIGKPIDSLKLLLETYNSSKKLSGVNHWWTIKLLVHLADSLQQLGHFPQPFVEKNPENLQIVIQDLILPDPQEIISLLKAAYKDNRHLISTDQKHIRRMSVIARIFKDMGDNDTASKIANDVYEQGRNSSDTMVQIGSIKCLNILGILKESEGKIEEALNIFRQAFAFSSVKLGDGHLHTLLYKRNMLAQLRDLGETDKALEGLREVLETLIKNYPNHADVFWTEMSIGVTLFKMKRCDESLALLVDLRTRIEERFGQTDPLLWQVNYWIEEVQNDVSR